MHAATTIPRRHGFGNRQLPFAHPCQQAEFDETARVVATGPQITVTQDIRDHAATVIMTQHALAGRAVDETSRCTPAATPEQRSATFPERRIEPAAVDSWH